MSRLGQSGGASPSGFGRRLARLRSPLGAGLSERCVTVGPKGTGSGLSLVGRLEGVSQSGFPVNASSAPRLVGQWDSPCLGRRLRLDRVVEDSLPFRILVPCLAQRRRRSSRGTSMLPIRMFWQC